VSGGKNHRDQKTAGNGDGKKEKLRGLPGGGVVGRSPIILDGGTAPSKKQSDPEKKAHTSKRDTGARRLGENRPSRGKTQEPPWGSGARRRGKETAEMESLQNKLVAGRRSSVEGYGAPDPEILNPSLKKRPEGARSGGNGALERPRPHPGARRRKKGE